MKNTNFVLSVLWLCMTACAQVTPSTPTPQLTSNPSPATPHTAFDPGIVLYRSDAHLSGVFDAPAVLTEPQQVWQIDPQVPYVFSLIYFEDVLYFSNSDGIYAYDASTGTELWQGGDVKPYVSAGAIAGDILVAGGYNDFVQALNRHTGEVLWTAETDSQSHLSAPLIVEDRVYIPAAKTLYSLLLQTGEIIWTTPLNEKAEFLSGPAHEAGKLFLSMGNSFLALNAETGEVIWQVDKEKTFYFPSIDNTHVYVGNADGFFYAYDLTSGREVWKFEGGSEFWFGPAVTEDTVYVGHFNGFMYALDKQTGDNRWEFKTDNWAVSEAVVSEGVVYFSDCWHEVPRRECHLYAVGSETGEAIWTYSADGTLLTAPALGEDSLYIILSKSVVALK